MSHIDIEKFIEDISSQLKHYQTSTNSNFKKWKREEETKDLYGILAPLESYMDVPHNKKLEKFWNCVDVGDIVIGRVVSKAERGLSLCLLCFDAGKSQAIESLEIIARCPRSEILTTNNHEDPLLRFSINDLVRAEIINIYHKEERLIVSFQCRNSKYEGLQYGLITEENLPVAYKRMCTSTECYDKLLHLTTGFYNPSVVEYLCGRLVCLKNTCNSFVNDLKNLHYSANELAASLRKRQSAKVAKRSVSKGINFYRKGQMLEALQELNYALDLDSNNVDALVARGALYANKRTFAKAIADFDLAIHVDPHNKNAKKYLTEVLIERAKSIEGHAQDLAQIKEAANLYRRALSLDPGCTEARNALGLLEKSKKHKRNSSTDSASSGECDPLKAEQSKKTATIVKVRQLLEKDVGKSHKKRESSQLHHRNSKLSNKSLNSSSSDSTSNSSSSSSSTSSSDSATDSSPEPKKRKLSSSSQKKYDKSYKKRKRSYSSNSSDSSIHATTKKKRKNSVNGSKSHLSPKDKNNFETKRHRKSSSNSDYSSRKKAKDLSTSHVYKPRDKKKHLVDSHNKNFRSIQRDLKSITSNTARKNSIDHKRDHQRRSSTELPHSFNKGSFKNNDLNMQESKSTHLKNIEVNKTLMKVTKDNFSNILDQISKFEVKRKGP